MEKEGGMNGEGGRRCERGEEEETATERGNGSVKTSASEKVGDGIMTSFREDGRAGRVGHGSDALARTVPVNNYCHSRRIMSHSRSLMSRVNTTGATPEPHSIVDRWRSHVTARLSFLGQH